MSSLAAIDVAGVTFVVLGVLAVAVLIVSGILSAAGEAKPMPSPVAVLLGFVAFACFRMVQTLAAVSEALRAAGWQ